MIDAVKEFYGRYAQFSGRSSRGDYWWPYLFLFLVAIVLIVLASVLGDLAFIVLGILYLASIVPSIAVGVRRLHDTGRSGAWWLINIVPFGSLVFFVLTLLPGTPGENRYGAQP